MIGFLTKDLIFQSRVSGAAKQAGQAMYCAFQVEALRKKFPADESPDMIIVDLTMPNLDIESVGAELKDAYPECTLVAYGPHVAEASLSRAQNSRFDLVLTRGQFDRDYNQLIQQIAK
jgi:DNA-binding NarL/FixJ family response regulator